RRLLASPDIQGIVEKALLKISIIEPGVGQRLGLADGCQVVDVVSRQPTPVNLVGVGVEPAAGPAKQFVEIAIDAEIEAAEMEGAPRAPARYVADVVGNVGRADIQALGGQSVMPFVEPSWGEPCGRAFVFGCVG